MDSSHLLGFFCFGQVVEEPLGKVYTFGAEWYFNWSPEVQKRKKQMPLNSFVEVTSPKDMEAVLFREYTDLAPCIPTRFLSSPGGSHFGVPSWFHLT